MDLADRVATAVERSVLPAVIARGGAVRVLSVDGDTATLEASGSPGAALPLVSRIEALVRAAVPEVARARIVGPGAESPPGAPGAELVDRVRQVLDREINPTIAAHRGHVAMVDVDRGRVHIRLEESAKSWGARSRVGRWPPARAATCPPPRVMVSTAAAVNASLAIPVIGTSPMLPAAPSRAIVGRLRSSSQRSVGT